VQGGYLNQNYYDPAELDIHRLQRQAGLRVFIRDRVEQELCRSGRSGRWVRWRRGPRGRGARCHRRTRRSPAGGAGVRAQPARCDAAATPPATWNDFEIEGDLQDPAETVRTLFAPVMQRRTSLTDDARNDIIGIARKYGYSLNAITTRDTQTGSHAVLRLAPLPLVRKVTSTSSSRHLRRCSMTRSAAACGSAPDVPAVDAGRADLRARRRGRPDRRLPAPRGRLLRRHGVLQERNARPGARDHDPDRARRRVPDRRGQGRQPRGAAATTIDRAAVVEQFPTTSASSA